MTPPKSPPQPAHLIEVVQTLLRGAERDTNSMTAKVNLYILNELGKAADRLAQALLAEVMHERA